MNFIKEKKVAQEAAMAAGKFLHQHFDKFDRSKKVKIKSKTQIQTWLDREAEKIILTKIKKHFPKHHILSEEKGENHRRSDFFWIIDPLDGTTNYTMHLQAYGLSIALAYKDKLILGVTYMPEADELNVAELGRGATKNGRPLKVSKISQLKESMLIFCHGSLTADIKKAVEFYKQFKLKGFDCRLIGSAVVEFDLIAAGRAEAVMLPGANLYDVAAGALLVREAGGKVTDFANKNWTIFSKDILASNGRIHNQILKIINENKS